MTPDSPATSTAGWPIMAATAGDRTTAPKNVAVPSRNTGPSAAMPPMIECHPVIQHNPDSEQRGETLAAAESQLCGPDVPGDHSDHHERHAPWGDAVMDRRPERDAALGAVAKQGRDEARGPQHPAHVRAPRRCRCRQPGYPVPCAIGQDSTRSRSSPEGIRRR